jgi:hypothetical protein
MLASFDVEINVKDPTLTSISCPRCGRVRTLAEIASGAASVPVKSAAESSAAEVPKVPETKESERPPEQPVDPAKVTFDRLAESLG